MRHSLKRRTVLGRIAVVVAATVLGAQRRALAAEPPRLQVDDPAARALGYTEDSTRVDPRKYPTYAAGSSCENCAQLTGKAGAPYRPCSVFPGKLVAARGWCTSWTAEM